MFSRQGGHPEPRLGRCVQEPLTGQAGDGLANDAKADLACLGKFAEVQTATGCQSAVQDSLTKVAIDILGQRASLALTHGQRTSIRSTTSTSIL